ncbi:MAG: YkgJ family cysteine cluster protein [Phycisphaerae bacterium]|nr:YkgJ family cysteine cluster protein [Phycisphaerae bacterium]
MHSGRAGLEGDDSVAPFAWYRKGLRFECTQCGQCCTGEPGYVWVTKEEHRRIARQLGFKDGQLPSKYIRRVGFRHSLTERANGDCIFLKRNGSTAGCEIYEVRPLQCRTWPFWKINTKSPDHWAAAALTCPGMDSGKFYDAGQIDEIREQNSW